MRAEFEGWQTQPASPIVEALAAVRTVQHLTDKKPLVLGVTPVARLNPFQSLLYQGFAHHGIAASPVNVPRDFPYLADLRSGGYDVAVHLHWLSFVLSNATTAKEAAVAVEAFSETLARFADAGGRTVWTIHNVLPHDAKFIDEEIALRQAVADAADVVHVMSRATVEAVKHTVSVDPDKVLFSPHPSYAGAYPTNVTREDARLALGIEPSETVFTMFGAIKPYKGLDGLLDAFDRAQRSTNRRLRLVVAGAPDGTPSAQQFVERCLAHPDVLIQPAKVPADHVQNYVAAGDIGLAPYNRILNSGAALLYTTFGLPVVVPNEASVRENLPAGAHVAFDGPDALGDALLEALDLVGTDTTRAVQAHARKFAPGPLAAGFAARLRFALMDGDDT